MKDPRVHENPLRRYRKIMPTFGLTNTCRLVVGVKIPAYLTAEAFDDRIAASGATAGLERAAWKPHDITRKAVELYSQCLPGFIVWLRAHARVVTKAPHAGNKQKIAKEHLKN
jgi:hypothetical protein